MPKKWSIPTLQKLLLLLLRTKIPTTIEVILSVSTEMSTAPLAWEAVVKKRRSE